jgi:hypothetical protein
MRRRPKCVKTRRDAQAAVFSRSINSQAGGRRLFRRGLFICRRSLRHLTRQLTRLQPEHCSVAFQNNSSFESLHSDRSKLIFNTSASPAGPAAHLFDLQIEV